MQQRLAGLCVMATLVGVGIDAGAPADARPGKVVRVERHAVGPRGTPRFCTMSLTTTPQHGGVEAQGYCFAHDLAIGETVVGFTGSAGAAVRIDQTSPYSTCSTGAGASVPAGVWTYHGVPDASVTPQTAQALGGVYGMVDGNLEPATAQTIAMTAAQSPSGRATDQTILGIDKDGDGKPDFVFVAYLCSDASAPSAQGPNQCYELYGSDGGTMRRLHTEMLKMC
jgi:hypothetical protein|nr:hypothetical protein [Kofleriaceae bacterium]